MLSVKTVFCLIFILVLASVKGQVQNGQSMFELRRRVRLQPSAEVNKPILRLATTTNEVNESISTVNITALNETSLNLLLAIKKQNQEAATTTASVNETVHRIVGGRQVSIAEVPWQAAIIQDGNFVCGGSVISTIWVLTAAHCVYGFGNSTFIVRAGSDTFRSGGQGRRVGFTAVHGQYNRNTFSNDIAMLKTTRRFTFNSNLRPVRVPSASARIPNAFFVSGWGSTSQTSTTPTRRLRGVRVNRINRRTCARNYNNTQYTITANMICASAAGADSCQGDSGGGIVNGGVIYGIVSFGIGCANSSYPGVNTNVPYMSPWIANVARIFSRRRNLDFQDPDKQRGVNIVLV